MQFTIKEVMEIGLNKLIEENIRFEIVSKVDEEYVKELDEIGESLDKIWSSKA